MTNTSENVDAFDLTAGGYAIVSTTGDYDRNRQRRRGNRRLACKAGTPCSRFFTGTDHSLLRLADIETGTLLP